MEHIILHIRQILKRPNYKTPLGRWHMEKSNKQINNKIDRANEDHCGPCGKNITKPEKKT
jgi:hypothetical protein